jgi:methyl-accepting chemotaxis protein
LNKLKISTRLGVLIGVLALLMLGMLAWLMQQKYEASLRDRQQLVRHQVESAGGVLQWAHGLEASGKASRAEAQALAKAAIARMRYGADEYFFINDMNVQMVMHPIKPALDGTDLRGFTDPNGKALFVAFVDKVRADKAGYVDYLWPRPGQDQPVDKLTYVAGFAPWGWVIGSGLYIDDLRAQFWSDVRQTGAVLLLVLGAAGAFSVLVSRSIVRRLALAVAAADAVAGGDLARPIACEGRDEVATLMQRLLAMRDSLAHVVGDVRRNAHSVVVASEQIAMGNNDLSSRTEAQASALEETAASMEQLGSAVKQNADNAQLANQLALGASSVAAEGGTVVGEVVDTMRGINESSAKIADIIGVINNIAFQTNILALNAAVEAARAGEQGRGFAVVAAEVRSLAQRSAQASKEIGALITASVERVKQGSELVDRAGATMRDIVGAIGRVTDIIGEISSASSEQSAGVAQVGEAVVQMDQATQQNAALVEQSAAAAESLKQQAHQLVRTVSVFTLAEGAAQGETALPQTRHAAASAPARKAAPRAPAPTPTTTPTQAPTPRRLAPAEAAGGEWTTF